MEQKPQRFTLRKNERLYERKAIDELFEKGRSIKELPLRTLWLVKDDINGPLVRPAFSVPAKIFKRAVDRNLLKRRMREAYRKNKTDITNAFAKLGKGCHIMFIYSAKDIEQYAEIESKIILTLQRLIQYAQGSK